MFLPNVGVCQKNFTDQSGKKWRKGEFFLVCHTKITKEELEYFDIDLEVMYSCGVIRNFLKDIGYTFSSKE